MQDKPINKATMKRIFLLFSLLLGVLSAWAYDVELDGIFYNLDKENKMPAWLLIVIKERL